MTQPHFLSFVNDDQSTAAIASVAEAKGWPKSAVQSGGIESAILALENQPSPAFLLVEVPSAEEAPALLDRLADVCDAGTKVIVTSHVNEFSFYSWLKDIGIHEYLLQPITEDALNRALTVPPAASPQASSEAATGTEPQTTAFIGARGGVGTTTLLCNLAVLLSRQHEIPTAVLDLDPHFGSVAMTLDREASRGFHKLLEKPDRIDALFLDRIMIKYSETLSLLSGEDPMSEPGSESPAAIEALLRELQKAHRHTVLDVPRTLTPATRKTLELADQIVIVTDLSPLGLRDTTRLHDWLVGELKRPAPLVVANQQGKYGSDEVKPADFAKHYGHSLALELPHLKEAATAAATGEMLLDISKNAAFLNGLNQLASLLDPALETTGSAQPTKEHLLAKWLKGK